MSIRARGWVLPFLGCKAKPVEPQLKAQMEAIWERRFGKVDPTKRAVCPKCRRAFGTEAVMREHLAAKHPDAAP